MFMVIDADNLKNINDQYGHVMGDVYIQKIAGILQDAVDGHGICARMGGDEFVAFLYGVSSITELEDIVTLVKKKCGDVFTGDKMNANNTFSFL